LAAVRQATFGMGCFWKPSEELLKVDGVVNTIVGYTGHPDPAVAAPSYESVCYGRYWVEGVRVEYEDLIISYDALLDAFFDKQEPRTGSRQYASIIFPHDDEQKKTATVWLEANQNRIRSSDGLPAMITKIEPLSAFFQAEEYHQQYWQKTRPRFGAMLALTAIASGLIDRWITPTDWISPLHTTCNALVLAGLLFVTLERKIQTKTVQI
jgi:peptide-methionine (S)-S-oxide reductase